LKAEGDLRERVTRLAVAFDSGPEECRELLVTVQGDIDVAKIGLTLFAGSGPGIVREVVSQVPVFLDLKLHDIPAQVAGAATQAASLGVAYLTVHAGGGGEMVAEAVKAVEAVDPGGTRILAVTVLTSLDDEDLGAMGIADGPEKQVLRLAELALGAGAHGLVCSPLEVAVLRDRIGDDPILVVPGIRPQGATAGDQKRTLTPAEAAGAGADVIVVGRPITAAADPRRAAARIRAELGLGRAPGG
jgi:orotidine-5'-phosphate decarboxylase